jgi:hypothetical protein
LLSFLKIVDHFITGSGWLEPVAKLVAFGVISDLSSIASALSAVLALVIAFQAYRAYNYTAKGYLLAFVAGFILLALSFVLLIPLAFGIDLPAVGYENNDILNYPPRIVMQSIGFILIGLSYSQTPRAKHFLYGLFALLVLLVVVVILPQAPPVPYEVNSLLYLLNTGLLAYVLYHMMEKAKPTDLVFIGFLLMALSQYTGLIDTLQYGELTFFLTQAIRLVSLFIFFAAFLRLRNPRVIKESG